MRTTGHGIRTPLDLAINGNQQGKKLARLIADLAEKGLFEIYRNGIRCFPDNLVLLLVLYDILYSFLNFVNDYV